MEVAMELEDDLFFADLSKQISLLIMDEDDDPIARYPSVVSLQAFSRAIHPPTQSPNLYEQNCRRECKGTGVFIPRSAQPRRKNRQGRNSHGQAESTRMVSQVSYKNSLNPK